MIGFKRLKVGKIYYFGVSIKEFKCIEVGFQQSKFIDDKKVEYQFYNEDMHLTKFKPISKNH